MESVVVLFTVANDISRTRKVAGLKEKQEIGLNACSCMRLQRTNWTLLQLHTKMAGAYGAVTHTLGSATPGASMDPLWGAPPTSVGSSGWPGGIFDPLVSPTMGSGPRTASLVESPLSLDSFAMMGRQAETEEASNNTLSLPFPVDVDDDTSFALDLNTGEHQVIFNQDMAVFRRLLGADSLDTVLTTNRVDVLGPRTHQLQRPMCWSRVNYFLRTELGRTIFGKHKSSKLLHRVFKLGYVQETRMLDDQRVRSEQTNTGHIKGIVRTPDVWLSQGLGYACRGAEHFVASMRFKWKGVGGFEENEERARKKETRGTVGVEDALMRLFDVDRSEAPPQIASVFDVRAGRDFDLAERDSKEQEYMWQFVPLLAPPKMRPNRRLYHNESFIGRLRHVGTRMDSYDADGQSVARDKGDWTRVAREAIYPARDDDSYKKALYALPRAELNLRSGRVHLCD